MPASGEGIRKTTWTRMYTRRLDSLHTARQRQNEIRKLLEVTVSKRSSHRKMLPVRQNSQSTGDPEILGSDRTDKLSLSFGRPLQGSTDESLSLRSQERPQGITSKIGSAHSEKNVSHLSSGKPEEHGIKRIQKFQDRTSVPSALENRCGEHRHKKETSFKITNSKYMTKVFPNLQKKLAGVPNQPKFAMGAYETNMLIWTWFMTSSRKAVIHLEPRHNAKIGCIQEIRIRRY